ncbi:hypothetical protein ACFLVV_01175 [Chloroflexota bacterium]
MREGEETRKPTLLILLGVGMAVMCIGLVLALGGFEIGCERDIPQEDTPQEDTPRYSDSMVIYMADDYLESQGRYPQCGHVTHGSYTLRKDAYYRGDGVWEVRYYCRSGGQKGTGNLKVTVYLDESELFAQATH